MSGVGKDDGIFIKNHQITANKFFRISPGLCINIVLGNCLFASFLFGCLNSCGDVIRIDGIEDVVSGLLVINFDGDDIMLEDLRLGKRYRNGLGHFINIKGDIGHFVSDLDSSVVTCFDIPFGSRIAEIFTQDPSENNRLAITGIQDCLSQ